jgi:hypothetical protein
MRDALVRSTNTQGMQRLPSARACAAQHMAPQVPGARSLRLQSLRMRRTAPSNLWIVKQ